MIEGEAGSTDGEEDIPFIPTEPNPFWKKNAEKIVGESLSIAEGTANNLLPSQGCFRGFIFTLLHFPI